MSKKKICLLLAAVMAVSGCLAGCGGGSQTASTPGESASASEGAAEAGETEGKDSLVIALSSDILSMDPYRYDEGPTNQIMLHMYEGLVSQAPDMSFEPCLAESREQSEDALTWTFHLRDGVKFHDGEVLDSADVLASIETASNPDSPSAFSSYTSTFSSVEVPAIKNVRFRPITNEATRTMSLPQPWTLPFRSRF